MRTVTECTSIHITNFLKSGDDTKTEIHSFVTVNQFEKVFLHLW